MPECSTANNAVQPDNFESDSEDEAYLSDCPDDLDLDDIEGLDEIGDEEDSETDFFREMFSESEAAEFAAMLQAELGNYKSVDCAVGGFDEKWKQVLDHYVRFCIAWYFLICVFVSFQCLTRCFC